jgi:hypothetical protein
MTRHFSASRLPAALVAVIGKPVWDGLLVWPLCTSWARSNVAAGR